MMSQDNRLLPLPSEQLDRPLRDLAAAPVPVPAISTEQPHLREYLAVVLKRKWLILSLVVIVTSLVTIHMYRMPSVYQASTQIKIEQKARSVVETGRGGAIQIRSNDPNYWNTQLQMLKTQKLARQVILRLDLQNNPAFLGAPQGTGVIAGLRRLVSGGKAQPQAQPDAAAGVPVVNDVELTADQLSPEMTKKLEPYEDALSNSLIIEPIERTNLVNIHFQHTDPQVAANVTNTLATIFSENDIRAETSGSQKAEDVLANQIIELQSRIQANEQKRINYKQDRGIPLTDKPGADFVALRLSTYSSQLQDAEAKRKDAESVYFAAMRTREVSGVWSIPEVIKNDSIQKLRARISELEEQLAALRVVYTEEWPAVIKLRKQVEELKAQLDKAPEEVFIGLQTQYEAAKKKEAELRTAYFSERAQAAAQGIAVTGLTDLNQQIETDRQNLNLYQQRLNELRVTNGDRAAGNVSTVEEARVPREPIGPQRGRNIMVALLLSLGVGVGLAFLLDYLDDSLKSVEDVDRHLHVPTLALIPAPREARRLLGRGAPEPEPGAATALALISDVRSAAAEAYRHLRTSLLLSSAGQPPKTVLVTSSQPSEGKTTTVVNLATMLAQTGAEVLVLDCDLRRPRVHAHFGIANTKGVTNYLSGESNVSSLIQSYDKLPNLKILPSGPVPPNAAELLGSDEMRKLLYVLSEHFTHIVIDSPPAISFTDASILSTMVDGVMLVVHGGHTSRSTARRAKQQLQDVGAHLFGIVLNNVKLEGTDYYYSGYYSGYYAAEEEDAPEGAEAAGGGAR
ncbi:MAG TPA: polysaccharide biosynthesis tyrosine autokinase [Pyrinomonadaceae bacterium]|nr:polysaccharide biosynthesis tyrosine autokinase [Pyrinomonadaceae bacterium]